MAAVSSSLSDTIVACATPPGEGAIAVVRLSGQDASSIADSMVRSAKKRPSHRMLRAAVQTDDGRVLDDALMVEMHAPHSYTGETVVEFHLHGSPLIVQNVVQHAISRGARPAEAGEFSLRAFLHGKISLDQAEGVDELIGASTKEQAVRAAGQVKGQLNQKVQELLDGLEKVVADVRAAFDFPEHPTGDGLSGEHIELIKEIKCSLQALIENAQVDLYRKRTVVLCGAPNVGKSTLLNGWAGSTRALVDGAPGTTRDPVEVEIGSGLKRWRVVDTAGIRVDAEGLEAKGIELSLNRIEDGDWVLWIVDPLNPQWPPESILTDMIIGGKSDLADENKRLEIESEAERRGLQLSAWVSGLNQEGLADLAARFENRPNTTSRAGEVIITRERHVHALKLADEALGGALRDKEGQWTVDVVASQLEEATRALGAILGRDVDIDVLDRIFSQFCIGK